MTAAFAAGGAVLLLAAGAAVRCALREAPVIRLVLRPARRRLRRGRRPPVAPPPAPSATGCPSASRSWARGWQVHGGATPTYYQLACPGRGQSIGGLDADRSRAASSVTFLGDLGGPVSPGVTTRPRGGVRRADDARTSPAFRPLLGCIPAGRRRRARSRTVYEPAAAALTAAAPVVEAIDPPGQERAPAGRAERAGRRTPACPASGCSRFSHAVAFRTRRPPSLAALGSVRATSRRVGGRVVTSVRSGITRPIGVRAELQVHAICVGGRVELARLRLARVGEQFHEFPHTP